VSGAVGFGEEHILNCFISYIVREIGAGFQIMVMPDKGTEQKPEADIQELERQEEQENWERTAQEGYVDVI